MFESDDFDQVLSQFDFPEVAAAKPSEKENLNINSGSDNTVCKSQSDGTQITLPNRSKDTSRLTTNVNNSISSQIVNDEYGIKDCNTSCVKYIVKTNKQDSKNNSSKLDTFVSPKHTKRKIINSYFDHQSKRKFPGPAGLLTGSLEEPKDDSICQIELLSQDIDCTQHNLRRDLFDSPIWKRLQNDTQEWGLQDIDSIKAIKQQALSGNLRRRKAQTVTAFVETVDRSATDPLIILRDSTGSIKCTLHRDAWFTFSPYVVSEYCALVLQKPTVLTTGSAFKKHYLNITLSNIMAIYSSAVLNADENRILPDGYKVVYEEEFTVIKTEKGPDTLGLSFEQSNGAEDLYDGLDNIFSDDIF